MNPKFDPFDPSAWSAKPGCEAFEIALEVQARGALADGAVPVLDAHLATCESCQQHAARTVGLDRAFALAAPQPPDWQRARAGLETRLRTHRRAPWYFALGGVLTVGVVMGAGSWLGAAPREWLGAIPIMLFLVAGMVLLSRVLAGQAVRQLAAGDLVASYRRDLEKTAQASKVLIPINLVVAATFLARAIYTSSEPLETPEARFALFCLWLSALAFAAGVVGQLWARKRLIKTLAELG